MIRITLTSITPAKAFTFKTCPVRIGSTGADIILSGLQAEHLKIFEENGSFFVVNSANDPFVTLNDLPFGKKNINNHDTIQIGSHILKFEANPNAPREVKEPPKRSENIDLAALFREVEELEGDDREPLKLKSPAKIDRSEPTAGTGSQPHYASVIEADDEIEPLQEKKEEPSFSQSKIWRLFSAVGSVLLIFIAIGFAIAYLKVDDKSTREQMVAAEGVADVSMALAYAQVNHITPQKQNWFDPDFLKNNLISVLSAEYPSFANIDNLGQFQNCPYILRIYTSTDLKQFLVIAQPEPTLLHWLFPRPAIAVDSKTMEMRKISNIKALNRLLANPNVLDSPRAAEISYLVRQGELIELSSFLNNQGFAAPKALSLVRPGSENLIYNAPRYYHFTEALLIKSLSLLQILGSSYEVTRLQQQMSDLSQFSNLVLYSSQGMQKAIQAQKALAMLVPNHPFMVAYLNLSNEGYITNSHLLLNDDHSDFLASAPTPQSTVLGLGSLSNVPKLAGNREIADARPFVKNTPLHEITSEIDPNHPLLLRLAALTADRQRALKSVSDRMIVLLNGHDEGKTVAFSDNFSKLLTWYLQVEQQRQEKIMQELKALYQEYSAMPLSQFTDYVKVAGLGLIARESLTQFSVEIGNTALTPEQVGQQFQKIQAAKSFSELSKVVAETASMLSLIRMPDHEKLISYQNEMRLRTLQQLSKFMLSPSSRLPPSEFSENNRIILGLILKDAWVIDNDEMAFYLNEFDLLIEENQKPT